MTIWDKWGQGDRFAVPCPNLKKPGLTKLSYRALLYSLVTIDPGHFLKLRLTLGTSDVGKWDSKPVPLSLVHEVYSFEPKSGPKCLHYFGD